MFPKNHPTALTTFRESLPLSQANSGNRRCFRRYVLIANSGYRNRYPFVAAATGCGILWAAGSWVCPSPWRRPPMPVPPSSPADAAALEPDDWRRIRDALLYLGRDLHHRSFAVHASRRELLWQEMDRCLALAERIGASLEGSASLEADQPPAP